MTARSKKIILPFFKVLLLSGIMWLAGCLPVSRAPYQQKRFYRRTQAAIQNRNLAPAAPDTVRVGWAKINITPAGKAPLAGYGKRKGAYHAGIHDSIWVRAFVFKNKTQKVAYVSLDLLIVPIAVTKVLNQALPGIGFTPDQTYLTATHTHSSLGGWARHPAGYVMAGKYDQKVVNRLRDAILSAIRQAEARVAPAEVGLASLEAPAFVYNRLVGDKGSKDNQLRVLKIKQRTGKTAVLCSFAAHATCLPAAQVQISGDYPGALVRALEKQPGIGFAAFSAGAVGSHGPAAPGEGFARVEAMAAGLSGLVAEKFPAIPVQYQTRLAAAATPLYLRSPHWRFARNWRFHPLLFHLVLGKYPASLKAFRLGDLYFAGFPCDFSGELLPELREKAGGTGQVVVTSFNGGYIGYVTPDAYYDLKKYETRDMNFFGPGTGGYLSEMMGLLLQRLQETTGPAGRTGKE